MRTTFCLPLPFFLPWAPFAATPSPNPHASSRSPGGVIPSSVIVRDMPGFWSAARILARASLAAVEVGSEGKSSPELARGGGLREPDAATFDDDTGGEMPPPPPPPSEGNDEGEGCRETGAEAGVSDGKLDVVGADAPDEPAALHGVEPPTTRFFWTPALRNPTMFLALLALINAGNGFERGWIAAGPLDVAARSTRSHVVEGRWVRC